METIKPSLTKDLSKEDKLSSLIKDGIVEGLKLSGIKAGKDGTVRVSKKIGAIFSLGTFIVAIVSLFIAAYSFGGIVIIKKLDRIEIKQAHFEKEIKANQAHFEKELTEIKTNMALILERLPKKD